MVQLPNTMRAFAGKHQPVQTSPEPKLLLATGGTHVYTYQVPERAGPGPNEVSSKLWMCAPVLPPNELPATCSHVRPSTWCNEQHVHSDVASAKSTAMPPADCLVANGVVAGGVAGTTRMPTRQPTRTPG